MLAPHWVFFVLLCPLLHQFDSQQPSTIIKEFLVKTEPFVLQHCKKKHHFTLVLASYWVLFVLFCPHLHQFDSQQPSRIIQEFSGKIKTYCSKTLQKKTSHRTGVSTILGLICFIVSSSSSVWFTTTFYSHSRTFGKSKNFCSKALRKKHHITLVLAPYWVLFVLLCPLLHQFDSQQPSTIIQEFSVK